MRLVAFRKRLIHKYNDCFHKREPTSAEYKKEHLYRDHGFRIQCSGDMLHEICRIIHLIDTGTVIRQATAPDNMTATSWNRNWELRMISRLYCCV